MPVKLIGTIILLVIVTIFCGFNLDEVNKCDVNLVFYTFHKVPVFLTVLVSVLGGIVVTLPFVILKKHSAKALKKEKSGESEKHGTKESEKLKKQQAGTEKNAEKTAKKPAREEEMTIFDFKIRRPEDKKSSEGNVNNVPKPANPVAEEK